VSERYRVGFLCIKIQHRCFMLYTSNNRLINYDAFTVQERGWSKLTLTFDHINHHTCFIFGSLLEIIFSRPPATETHLSPSL
jgi:hypothetical protein